MSRLFLTMAFLLPLTATAEVVCALGSTASAYQPSADQPPSRDTMQLIRRVNTAYERFCLPKCPAVAAFRNSTAANAMLIVTNSDAKLVYSPEFFAKAYGQYGDGAILAIVAHVYGHAIAETTPATWLKPNWTPELRADAWAGCALAKIELSANDLKGATSTLSTYRSTAHPNWSVRLPVLRLGYTHCGGDGAKFDSAAK